MQMKICFSKRLIDEELVGFRYLVGRFVFVVSFELSKIDVASFAAIGEHGNNHSTFDCCCKLESTHQSPCG